MMMKKICFSLLLFVYILPIHAQDFLSVAPDIPLAPGLQEVESGGVIFDKPKGRIITIEALGVVSGEKIMAFYRSVLPNLGWVLQNNTPLSMPHVVFRRGNEKLIIRSEGGVVFFQLLPMSFSFHG